MVCLLAQSYSQSFVLMSVPVHTRMQLGWSEQTKSLVRGPATSRSSARPDGEGGHAAITGP